MSFVTSYILCCCCCVDTLRDYFSQYGVISECTVMKDPVTRRSRYQHCSCTVFCREIMFIDRAIPVSAKGSANYESQCSMKY